MTDDGRLLGIINIELRALKTGPASGSGHVDLAHDAYSLRKQLADVKFKDVDGKVKSIGEKYEVGRVTAETE